MVSLLPLHSDLLGKSQVPGPQPGFSIFTPYSPLSWKLCFKICVCLFSNSNCHEFFCILRGKMGFPGGSDGKQSTCNAGDLGSIPGLGRSPGGGHGNPLQYSCLENPHGQRILLVYSPWGRKELDMTKCKKRRKMENKAIIEEFKLV